MLVTIATDSEFHLTSKDNMNRIRCARLYDGCVFVIEVEHLKPIIQFCWDK
jgi:hypothetical protein